MGELDQTLPFSFSNAATVADLIFRAPLEPLVPTLVPFHMLRYSFLKIFSFEVTYMTFLLKGSRLFPDFFSTIWFGCTCPEFSSLILGIFCFHVDVILFYLPVVSLTFPLSEWYHLTRPCMVVLKAWSGFEWVSVNWIRFLYSNHQQSIRILKVLMLLHVVSLWGVAFFLGLPPDRWGKEVDLLVY